MAADGDSKWLDTLADLYHLCIYNVDTPFDESMVHLQTPANRGHEAMAYLTFLIDNYEDIPAAGAVFVHGSRWAWHNDAPDYDNASLLSTLNVSAALAPLGYHNLRCDWSASTCLSSSARPQGSLETTFQATVEPWNARAVSDAALPSALVALFGDPARGTHSNIRLGRGDTVRSQCCAQFVVSRDRVWQHSRDEYTALRHWLLDGMDDSRTGERSKIDNAAPRDDRVAGRIFSYIWHILFLGDDLPGAGDPSSVSHLGVDLDQLNTLACPRADECYCRLYNRCGLEGCFTPDRCLGQYSVPPRFKLTTKQSR